MKVGPSHVHVQATYIDQVSRLLVSLTCVRRTRRVLGSHKAISDSSFGPCLSRSVLKLARGLLLRWLEDKGKYQVQLENGIHVLLAVAPENAIREETRGAEAFR